MFENILKFFRKLGKNENKETNGSKNMAKERLHLVLMQDRANVSADFLEMMKQEIIEVIKKYIEVEEKEIDVRLTNEVKEDGTTGAPSLYANIPILNIKNDMKKELEENKQENKKEEEKKEEDIKQEKTENDDNKEKEDKEEKTEEVETDAKQEEKSSKVKEAKVKEKVKSKSN